MQAFMVKCCSRKAEVVITLIVRLLVVRVLVRLALGAVSNIIIELCLEGC